MKLWKPLATTSIAISAVIGMAAPAMAAETSPSLSDGSATTVAPTTAKATAPTSKSNTASTSAQNGGLHPQYAAGSYYYVCVFPDGNSLTVLAGQKTVTQCGGASAVQQWLDSGQLVRTVQLTTSGKTATATFNGSTDCYLAIAGSVVFILDPPAGTVLFATGATIAAASLHSCISS